MHAMARCAAALAASIFALCVHAAPDAQRAWSVPLAETSPPEVRLDARGNVITAHSSFGTQRCLVVRKLHAMDGALAWERQVCRTVPATPEGSPFPSIDFDFELDAAGDVIAAAYLGFNRHVVRLSGATGAVTWEQASVAEAQGRASGMIHVAVAPDGDYRLMSIEGGATRVLALRRSDGGTIWSRDVAAADSGIGTNVAVDNAGYTVVLNGNEGRLKRLDAFGSVAWDIDVGGQTDGRYFAVDSGGNVFVHASVIGTASTFHLRKFRASDGAMAWQQPAMIFAMALDSGDNLVASVRFDTTPFTFAVVKYGADGTPLWQRALPSPANTRFYALHLDSDTAGNVIAAAANAGTDCCNNGGPFRLFKLAARDGRVVWEEDGAAAGANPDAPVSLDVKPSGIAVSFNGRFGGPPGVARYVERNPPLSRIDFDADATADVPVRAADGSATLWLMQSGLVDQSVALIAAGTGWSATHAGDFDGDGHADLLWRHTDGRTAMWLMRNGAQVGGAGLIPAGTGWGVKLVADFNADGKDDIVWQHADGRVAMWLMDGARQAGGTGLIGAGTGWSATHAADFNGDAKADLVFQHTDGRSAMWLMDGARQAGGTALLGAGTGWSVKAAADFTADGRGDLVWQHTDGRVALWYMDGTRIVGSRAVAAAAAEGREVLATGDFDGDGLRDVLVLRGGALQALLLEPTGSTFPVTLSAAGSGFTLARVANLDDDPAAELVLNDAVGSVRILKLTGPGGIAYTLASGGVAATLLAD